ncbi:hypothetical protein ACFQGS_14955 [Novosphingobium lubricantis]
MPWRSARSAKCPARWSKSGPILAVERNRAMLVHLLDAVLAASPAFRHIAVVHGTKAYGVHLPGARLSLPHREDDPRVEHENFYFAHEDELARRARGQDWSWTIFRAGPDEGLFEVVDADLLGRAMVWAMDAASARGEIFNIANGDVARWRSLWPVIAHACGATPGADRPGQSCVALARALTPEWADAVARHGLAAPADLGAFLGESFALLDFALPSGIVSVMSTIKLRKAGFHGCEDTPERLRAWLARWQAEGLLPPPEG